MPDALTMLSQRLERTNRSESSGGFTEPIDEGKAPTEYLKDIGGYGLGVIGAVGNVLDVPGSMVRDMVSSILTGKWVNPFDQLLTPTSSDNRTTGRQLLEQAGFRKNKESVITDWIKDPYEGALDIGGFMIEVMADPTAPMKWTIGGMTGVDRLITRGVKGTASKSYGIARGFLRKAPVVGEPFSDLVDKGIALANQLFNVRKAGVSDPKYWDIAEKYYDDTTVPLDRLNAQGALVLTRAQELGMKLKSTDPDFEKYDDAFRKYMDGVEDDGYRQLIPEDLVPQMEALRASALELQVRLAGSGGRTSQLVDTALHWHRFMGDELRLAIEESTSRGWVPNSINAFNTNHGVMAARETIFKGFVKGTVGVDELMKDDRIQGVVQRVYDDFMQQLDPNSRIAAAFDHVGPAHLDRFAKQLDTTGVDLWEKIGLSRDKPYEFKDEVLKRLTSYRRQLDEEALSGVGSIRPREGKTQNFIDIVTGNRVRVTFDENGLPVGLPNGQTAMDLMPGPSDNPFVQQTYDRIRGDILRDNPEGLRRFEQGLQSTGKGGGVLSWLDADGQRRFYQVELKSTLSRGWKGNKNDFLRQAGENPVSQKQATVDAVHAFINREYKDLIRDEMPHFDTNGNIVFDYVDEAGKVVKGPDGRPLSMALSPKEVLEKGLQDPDGAFNQARIDQFFNKRGMRPPSKADLARNKDALPTPRKPGTAGLRPRLESRHRGLAFVAGLSADVRNAGVFGNNAIVDFLHGARSTVNRIAVNNAIRGLAGQQIRDEFLGGGIGAIKTVPLHAGALGKGPTFKKLLMAENGIDSETMRGLIYQDAVKGGYWKALADDATPEVRLLDRKRFNEYLDDVVIDQQTYQELVDYSSYFREIPEMTKVGQVMSAFNAITKSNLLSTPRTVLRDMMSGSFMGWIMGDLRLDAKGAQRAKDGLALATGRRAAGSFVHKDLIKAAQDFGLDPNNPDHLQKAFVHLYMGKANQVAGVHAQMLSDELVKAAGGKADAILNSRPVGVAESMRRIYGDNIVRDVDGNVKMMPTLWNMLSPTTVPGSRRWDPDTKEWIVNSRTNLAVGFHSAVRGTADNTIRMTGVLNRMDQGMSFEDAFNLVNKNQINYDPRTFTRFEKRHMKQWFLFYSFMSRSLPLVASELIRAPGGRLGQVIRAQRVSQGNENSYVPYDLQDTAAIPWGQNAEGDIRYVTNLGLMHEDALRYLAPTEGIRGLAKKVIGSLNPAAKMLIEYGTNTSTFFDGPMGGRRLDDLDPLLGRILVNMGVRELPPSGRPEPVGGAFVEAVAANSPLSAALQYIRTISEDSDRRSNSEKAMNLLTGIRTRLITPEMMSRELRDRLNAEQIALGARPLTTVIGTSGLAERYQQIGEVETAEKLRTIEAGLRAIRKQLDARKKAEAK